MYPYRIFRGNLRLRDYVEIYDYPPISLTPSTNLKCDKDGRCMWVMQEGMMINYPLNNNNVVISVKNDKILKLAFVHINSTKLMYTGT